MFRIFILPLLFISLTYASTSWEKLNIANHLLATKKIRNIFRAYNNYKSLYLIGIVHKDKYLRIDALKGIIKSGKLLHIDVYSEVRELRKAKIHVYKTSFRKLLSVKWQKKYLVLTFNKRLAHNNINYFTHHYKNYQYILNIHTSIKHDKRLFGHGLGSIKIIREKKHLISLIVINKTPVKIRFFLHNKSIMIELHAINNNIVQHHKIQKFVSVKAITNYTNIPYIANQHRIIVIDPGHGGKDPGAIGYRGYKEKNIVLAIGLKLDKILIKRGYIVYMTRRTNRFITLRNRTKFANAKHADLFISIHANAVLFKERYEAYGIQTYYLSLTDSARADKVARREDDVDMSDMNYYGKSTWITFITNNDRISSNKLAINVESSVLQNLRQHYRYIADGGVRGGPFWVLVGAQMPSILIETGFVTNPREATRLINHLYQQRLAIGIANGIGAYFLLRDR